MPRTRPRIERNRRPAGPPGGRAGVARVRACHRRVEPGHVGHPAADGAGVVERGGKRQEAGAAHPSVRRLEAHHAAPGRRDPDRPPGVAASAGRDQAGRHRRRRPAARAAGRSFQVPRVPDATERRTVARRPIGELVGLELPEQNGAGRPEPGDDGRVLAGDEIGEEARAGGRPHPAGQEHVLVPDRDAVQRSAVPSGAQRPIRRPGRPEGRLRGQRDEAVEAPVVARDAREVGARQLLGREPARAQEPAGLGEAQLGGVRRHGRRRRPGGSAAGSSHSRARSASSRRTGPASRAARSGASGGGIGSGAVSAAGSATTARRARSVRRPDRPARG
jgi:hypothetical protein